MAKQNGKAEPKSEKRKLRVGVIGAGGIAGTHTDHYRKMEDVEVVAASDVSEASLKKYSEKYGINKTHTDWKAMLSENKLDAVSVCTPNGLHMAAAVDALNAGCNVLVEKPLAMNAVEGQKMLDASKKNKKLLVIGFQYRYDVRSRILRKAVEDGFFGKVMFVRVQALRRRGIPNWGVFGRKELQGGGPLIDIGVHALEMAHFVIGSPEPIAASGNVWTYMGNKAPDMHWCWWPNWDYKTYNVEDFAAGSIRTKTGTIIHVESSFAAHIEKDIFSFTIAGEKGGATWEPFGLYYDQSGMMLNATPHYVPKEDAFFLKMRNFVDACLYEKETQAPAEHGLMVQKMLDGIYASAAAGKEVKIE